MPETRENSRIATMEPSYLSATDERRALEAKTLKIYGNLLESCRLCLRGEQSLNIFDEYKNTMETFSAIAMSLADIQIDATDVFPKFICVSCASKLGFFYHFKRKCELANCTVRAIIPLGKTIKMEQDNYSDADDEDNQDDYHDYKPNFEELAIDNSNDIFQPDNLFVASIHVPNEVEALTPPPDSSKSLLRLTKTVMVKKDQNIHQHMTECHGNVSTRPKKKRSIPAQCDECGRLFTRKTDLMKHFTIHTGIKKFSCDICQQRFTRKPHLVAHMLIHNKIKPFTCEMCGYAFRKFSNLSRHKVVHSDQFAFSCEFCGKQFKRLTDLKTHRRIHTGRRIYKCAMCGNSYQSQSGYRKHLGTHKTKVINRRNDAEVTEAKIVEEGNQMAQPVIVCNASSSGIIGPISVQYTSQLNNVVAKVETLC